MIDRKENKHLRNSQINYANFSQFKEFNYEEPLTSIQERLYCLMLNGELIRGKNESLYGWCGRIGLSNSTIFGIFKKNNKNMHLSVAEKISQATGADAMWIKDGIGEPFPNMPSATTEPPQAVQTPQTQPEAPVVQAKPKTIKKKGLTLSTSIDIDKLREVFDTTEELLRTQNRTMPAAARGEFTVMLYKMFIGDTADAQDFDAQLLQNTTHAVESLLENKRLQMSPKNKTLLIIAIYTLYIDSPADIQLLINTSEILLRKIA